MDQMGSNAGESLSQSQLTRSSSECKPSYVYVATTIFFKATLCFGTKLNTCLRTSTVALDLGIKK